LDLTLYDPTGAVVMQGTSTDSQPIVGAAPAYSGNFGVRVHMFNCTVAPCYYAVGFYARQAR
jgi:hypothetical protein